MANIFHSHENPTPSCSTVAKIQREELLKRGNIYGNYFMGSSQYFIPKTESFLQKRLRGNVFSPLRAKV
jgi:hypothetical protein